MKPESDGGSFVSLTAGDGLCWRVPHPNCDVVSSIKSDTGVPDLECQLTLPSLTGSSPLPARNWDLSSRMVIIGQESAGPGTCVVESSRNDVAKRRCTSGNGSGFSMELVLGVVHGRYDGEAGPGASVGVGTHSSGFGNYFGW